MYLFTLLRWVLVSYYSVVEVSTTQKFMQRWFSPSCSEMIDVLPVTKTAPWMAAAGRKLAGIKSELSMLMSVLMGMNLKTASCQAVPLLKTTCLLRPARALADQLRSRCWLHPVQAWRCVQVVVLWVPLVRFRSSLLDHLPSSREFLCNCLYHPLLWELGIGHQPPPTCCEKSSHSSGIQLSVFLPLVICVDIQVNQGKIKSLLLLLSLSFPRCLIFRATLYFPIQTRPYLLFNLALVNSSCIFCNVVRAAKP